MIAIWPQVTDARSAIERLQLSVHPVTAGVPIVVSVKDVVVDPGEDRLLELVNLAEEYQYEVC